LAITTTPDDALRLAVKLCKRLDDRATEIEKYERYYEGQHNLRFATRKFRDAFGALFREFADNYCGLVVDSTSERLRIEGFRIPTPQKEKEQEEAAEKQEEAVALQAERAHELALAEASAATVAQAATGSGTPTGSAAPAPVVPPATPAAKPDLDVDSSEPQQMIVGDSATGDDEAWEIWQRNNLDLQSDLAHETALVTGYSYIMVGPQDDGSTENPLITIEHPLEVIHQTAPGNPTHVTAAIKRWYDEEEGRWFLTLYTPDSVFRYQSNSTSKNTPGTRVATSDRTGRWVPREGTDAVIKNPFPDETVPVIPIVNRQKINGSGRSELADIIPLQDAVNKLCNDMLVASEFAAFRQRILTGMEMPEDEHGNIIPDFDLKAAIDRIMVIKDENVKVSEFGVTDLSTYVKAIEHLRDDIAAISRTPPQYLVGEVVNVSSEALKAAESGLVQKAKRRCRFYGESWEQAMRIAFLLKGDEERAESYAAETIWANPEVMTEAALADSLSKYMVLGVPIVAIWERMGVSQTEIKRWLQLKTEEPELPAGWAAAVGSLAKVSQKDVE
jgi:hypothetical protein